MYLGYIFSLWVLLLYKLPLVFDLHWHTVLEFDNKDLTCLKMMYGWQKGY